jgi:hypothetical protein
VLKATMFRTLLATLALVLVSAGCSNNSQAVTPRSFSAVGSAELNHVPGAVFSGGINLVRSSELSTVRRPWNLPHVWPSATKQRAVLFVADPDDNQLLMYDPSRKNPQPEGSITAGIDYAVAIAVDRKSTVYVANLMGGSANKGSITIYKAGAIKPSMTITEGLVNPYSVAVDSNGNLFATNLDSNTIVGYRAGAKSPFETIDFSSYGEAAGLATDQKNNLWIANPFGDEVDEIPAGSSTPQNAGLSGLNGPSDVSVGQQDTLFASDFSGGAVSVYKNGSQSPWAFIIMGIKMDGPTYGGFTASGDYFQTNQDLNVVGYHKGKSSPFSTITGIKDPRGVASAPLVSK